MRISDWSSDVCSSDLGAVDALRLVALAAADQPDPVDLLRQRPMHDRHELSAEIRAVLRDLRSALAAHGNRLGHQLHQLESRITGIDRSCLRAPVPGWIGKLA